MNDKRVRGSTEREGRKIMGKEDRRESETENKEEIK
jgi:hypothetical protein